MENFFLMGMPYSGKTTLGLEVARELDFEFIDLDSEIERSYDKSIPEIFEDEGEDIFRKIESDTLEQIISGLTISTIISLGGGTPCFKENFDLIKSNGISIFLDVDLQEIIQRSKKDNQRPLLKGEDRASLIKGLYKIRRSCYKRADLTIPGNNISKSDLIKRIRS